MSELQHKTAIVIGSSRGIGREIAICLARQGCRVTITGRDEKALQNVFEECKKENGSDDKILMVVGDLKDESLLNDLISKTVAKFGHLDILVNNAATLCPVSAGTASVSDYDETMDTNLKAPLFLSQKAIPYLKESKGTIINISSLVVSRTEIPASMYAISKAALDQLTITLSLELAPFGVRVNTISPGIIDSTLAFRENSPFKDEAQFRQGVSRRMWQAVKGGLLLYNTCPCLSMEFLMAAAEKYPLKRFGQPSDVANVVEFLCSDKASFITGNIVEVDGGMHNAAIKCLNA